MRTSSSSLPRKRKRKDLSPLDTVHSASSDGRCSSAVRRVGRQRGGCYPRRQRLSDVFYEERDDSGPSAAFRKIPGNDQPDDQHAGGKKRRDESDESKGRRRKRRRSATKDIARDKILPLASGIVRSAFLLALLCAQCYLAGTDALAGTQKYSTRTVKTRYGVLRGVEARSSTAVETYYGVPYATPPLGALRYMPPVTPTPWRGTKFADTMPPACPQRPPKPDASLPRQKRAYLERLVPMLANQSEDCLYLNLYVPKLSHGESYMRDISFEKIQCVFYRREKKQHD